MNRILVPIDFPKPSGNSLRYVHSIAKHLGMNLSLLHCYPLREFNRPSNFQIANLLKDNACD